MFKQWVCFVHEATQLGCTKKNDVGLLAQPRPSEASADKELPLRMGTKKRNQRGHSRWVARGVGYWAGTVPPA
ncbi:MAG: hypothetical protein IPL33_11370 [Sphingobacteriales bacterium]|nr:hypothetical protein [Sphingobacteriales bacterium]MCC7222201.1 hypothetical protein [Chitinophagales bacterium]